MCHNSVCEKTRKRETWSGGVAWSEHQNWGQKTDQNRTGQTSKTVLTRHTGVGKPFKNTEKKNQNQYQKDL